MTREEARDLKKDRVIEYSDDSYVYNILEADDRINEIYDDFESRVCENCKFYKVDKLDKHLAPCSMWGISTRDEMSCKMFERKDK